MKKLRMEWVNIEKVDFDELMKRNIPSLEVVDRNVYKHKPFKNQGRFGSKGNKGK
jgi:hypothetical protein